MKRWASLVLSALLISSLAACGDGDASGTPPAESHENMTSQTPSGTNRLDQSEPVSSQESSGQEEAEGSHILIAYFTWADNTVVEDPSSVDVDATTSASVLAPGNAAKLAAWIQEAVGGDLYSIVVEEPYSSDYDECLDRAAEEKADNARPALATHVENMEDYGIVFLGFPNWWYTLPMPVLTFVTHGTGGLASTIRDLTAALPEDTTILDPIGVYRPEVDESQAAVQDWLAGLNLEF